MCELGVFRSSRCFDSRLRLFLGDTNSPRNFSNSLQGNCGENGEIRRLISRETFFPKIHCFGGVGGARIGGIAVVVATMFLSVLGTFENDFLLVGISGILLAGAAYCAVRLFFAENIIFETDCGFFSALVESWRLTRKRDWKTRILIFLCPVSLYFLERDMWFYGFLATPVLVVCFSVFYLKLRRTALHFVPLQTLA